MLMARPKHATTMATHIALRARFLAVEICTRPWIVELSRNSHIKDFNVILSINKDNVHDKRSESSPLKLLN